MKCHDWQEMIITDYLDGELEPRQKERLDAHLAQCQACREFLTAAQNTVVKPFEGAASGEPPECVWHNIKEAITEPTRQVDDPVSLWDRLGGMLNFPKPALALASVIIVFMAVTLTLRYYPQSLSMKNLTVGQGDVENIDYVIDELATYVPDDTEEELSSIEEYFL